MSNCNCLNNESQIDANITSAEELSAELSSPLEMCVDLENVVEIVITYTGVDTDDINMNVDNDNRTISATITDTFKNTKLDKTSTPEKVYGTDEDGNQTLYDVGSFGAVDDVIDADTEESLVTDKIARVKQTVVNDTLTSSSSTEALSAKQGKVLKEILDVTNENVQSALDGVAENAQAIQELTSDVTTIEQDLSDLENETADILDSLNEEISTRQISDSTFTSQISALNSDVAGLHTSKQDTLISGTNIKTINGETLLGAGNIALSVSSKNVIYTTGDNGIISEQDFALLIDDTKNTVIRNGVQEYELVAVESFYRTYMTKNTPDDTTITHFAIWVQTNQEALNYRRWSKEAVNPLGELETEVDEINTKLNKVVKTKPTTDEFSYSGDVVTFSQSFQNLSTGVTETTEEVISLANSSTAGMMSPADVQAISSMQTEIDQLKGRNIRLLFTAKSNPTAIEINAFVLSKGYAVSEFPSISVVVRDTNHIWRYSENPAQWLDYGIDTVNQATNTMAGIVKGTAETAGKVYVENDATMSVYGWDALLTLVNGKAPLSMVTNLENAIESEVARAGTAETRIEGKIDNGLISLNAEIQDRIDADTTINNALSAKANDNAVVHLTGDETVGGRKTFTSKPYYYNGTTNVLFATVTDIPTAQVQQNTTDIVSLQSGKVDKETGKGLSSNDYTDDDKDKLDGIADGATKVEASQTNGNIKINGVETTVYTAQQTTQNYNDLTNIPIINSDLTSISSVTTNQIYRHTGTTTDDFVQNFLYYNTGDEWLSLQNTVKIRRLNG